MRNSSPTEGLTQDVLQRVQPVVAGPVGDGDGPVVENGGEAGLVALRRHVGIAGAVGGADQHERALADEGAAMAVERLQFLADRAVGRPRRLVDRPQLFVRGDEFHGLSPLMIRRKRS